MTRAARVILLTALLAAAACSDTEEPDPSAEATEEPAPAGTEASEEPTAPGDGEEPAGAEPAEPEGEELEVVVKESHLRSSIPTDDETVVHAAVDEGTLEVHVENLEAACGPVPELAARLVPGRVVLRLVPPEDRHCIGRQEIKLRIDLPRGADVETVQLRGADGAEVVTVDVPS